MIKKITLGLALVLVSTAAMAGQKISVKMELDLESASTCTKGRYWNFTLDADHFSFSPGKEVTYRETVPVAADGSFDKRISLSAGAYYRLWGNVQTHELHQQAGQGLCKWNGTTWTLVP
jgi:hypothetical protein